MKKIISFLLVFMVVVIGGFYRDQPTVTPKKDRVVVPMKSTALLSNPKVFTDPIPILVTEPTIEQSCHDDDIPLTYEEQDWLQAACEEFDVPYALALGLIEKETTFRNIISDNGASAGYMQIQQKWHWDRMERLGVTDLLEPNGNFRVGCDFLAELYAKYNDWNMALTVYNMGHNPGYITDYAKDVMENYAHWQEVVNNYI